jgi:hypothetical protein
LKNPSFSKKKLLVIGFSLLDKKGKMDSHFHGNNKKKRGNDMREGKRLSPFLLRDFHG